MMPGKTLKRWYRILKINGTLRLSVPDIAKHIDAYIWFKDLKRLRSAFWR